MKIFLFIIFLSIQCDQFDDLLEKALAQTLPKPSAKINNTKQQEMSSQEQDILQQIFGDLLEEQNNKKKIALEESSEEQIQIQKDKDQITRLVEDIEKREQKQHPFLDDNFQKIAEQFAKALHNQTERMKKAQLLDETAEEKYHKKEVHPEVIVISERSDNIDHFDPEWEKNNNYLNIKRVPKSKNSGIEIIEIPDGYIQEPDHYHQEIKQQQQYQKVSSGRVYPKLGIKGNKKFNSELKDIFQQLGEMLNETQPPVRPDEEQKTNLNHVQATQDDTHYKFAKVTAKEHKIPKDKLDIQKVLEVIDQLQKKAIKI